MEDEQRAGRPIEIDVSDLERLLAIDSAQSTYDLAKQLGVSQKTVWNRLKALGKVQKEGKWMPHILSKEAILNRYNICIKLLRRHKKKSFLNRIVTGDEKWIYFHNPNRKRSWVDPGSPVPMTPNRDIHGKKILLSVWWDQRGVLLYELLPPGQTITSDLYSNQLRRLHEALLEKRPQYRSKRLKVIFQHDNARPHTGKTTVRTLLELGWEVLPHPAYSPDIAPSDYHLFRSMQHGLKGQSFRNEAEVLDWVDGFFASKPSSFYQHGIHLLPERWQKVIDSNGKYFN